MKGVLTSFLALVAAAGAAGGQSYSPSVTQQQIAWYHAPVIIQETWPDANVFKENHLVRADFDNDIVLADNWAEAERMQRIGSIAPRVPSVYYSITETEDAYYIGYYFYHVSDGGWRFCAGFGWCYVPDETRPHIGDLEGYWKVVEKHPNLTPWGIETVSLFSSHGTNVPGWNRAVFSNPGPLYYDQDGVGRYSHLQVLHWRDTTATSVPGLRRPVVMIRRTSHGTYPAADIHTAYHPDYGCGEPCGINPHDAMEWGQDTVNYDIRTHDGHYRRITYWPDPRDYCGTNGCTDIPSLAYDETWGSSRYTLVSFVNSLLWKGRTNPSIYEEHGSPFVDSTGIDTTGQTEYGRGCFKDGDDRCGAQPPWEWVGGKGGSCSFKLVNLEACSYHFGQDFTMDAHDPPINFKQIGKGALLAEPVRVLKLIWRDSTKSTRYLYNPYRKDPSKGDTLQTYFGSTIYVAINGTGEFNQNYNVASLTASISGSDPGFTWIWYTSDGQFQDGGSTFSPTVASNITAYIDVEDATGNHGVASKFLHFCVNADEGCDPVGDPNGGGGDPGGGGEDPCEPNCDAMRKGSLRGRGLTQGTGTATPTRRTGAAPRPAWMRPRVKPAVVQQKPQSQVAHPQSNPRHDPGSVKPAKTPAVVRARPGGVDSRLKDTSTIRRRR